MNYYSRVLEILEASVGGKSIKAHRNFWRGKSRDEFVKMKIFGLKIIEMNNGADSNIVKAMRGTVPFGSDYEPPLLGEIYRQMPAGMPPVDEVDIAFIENWIDSGCPEVVPEATIESLDASAKSAVNIFVPLDSTKVNSFFREFDDFFMFSSSDQITEDINTFFGGLRSWPGLGGQDNDWKRFLEDSRSRDSLRRLSKSQLEIIWRHFENPFDMNSLSRAFVRFGSGDLPDDPLRPQDSKHRMDGHIMWNVWLSFASAAIETGIDQDSWKDLARIVVIGMVHDSLYRSDRHASAKLHIKRYTKGQASLEKRILSDFSVVEVSQLPLLLVEVSLESLTPPGDLIG